MEEKSKEYTAFTTPDGHYQFKRMPFGLKNAPAQFSKHMHKIFGVRPYVEIYLDDIIIHSKSLDEHVEHIFLVAKLLRNAPLKIKPSKCSWFAKKARILGHVVSGKTIVMEQEKIEAVSKRLPPKNVKHRSNVWLLKKSKFIWTEIEQESFDRLKKALISKPILRQPDFAKTFIVYTDASGYAISGVLSQRDENENEYVIFYGSRLLKNAEIDYGITEKECLAVVWSIKRYRVYLYCTYFEVITDHSDLKKLMSINDPTARLARWAIYLQAHHFAIIRKKGNSNGNADALSRQVLLLETCNKVSKEEKEDISLKNSYIYDDENSLYYLKNGKMKPGLSRKQLNRNKKLTENMVYDNETEVIYYVKKTSEYVEIPTKEKRKELVKIANEFGHF
ncbi:unnamed protein product [Brachionus calyciflorus]|uniref:Reverse transcriptase domain-containing protein n=1 Tax=Brachionus calyciflorus TaxID=104777 RepID=A0A813PU31_9BILA|nr:unnamed protein product [Brachionus calyciflorus]